MNYLWCLTALIFFPSVLYAAPNFPFPQSGVYPYGNMPSTIDNNLVQETYEDFMELYEEQGDLARIKHDEQENTVSEGIAYGMMITVYMDNETNNTQPKFDRLWNYYKKFSGSVGEMMSWRIKGFEGVANPMMDQNAATDAELDAAVALLQAYKQWGDETYLADARELLGKMAEHEVNENGYLKPGDSWDNEKNVSYFSTGALELFKVASDFDWERVIQNSYSLIKKVQNSATGLVPDWCSENGTPSGGSRGNYYYDATRTPWRIAWAYSWYGHQDAKDICTKIASWITTKTGGDPSNIVTGYLLDGTENSEWHNATFVGPFVCAGMVDAAHQEWVDNGFVYLASLEESVYYQLSLKMLTMLYLSGNMPNFWTETQVENFTLTATVTPEGGGTVTAAPEGTEFASGTGVTLTAIAAEGFTFVAWGGDAAGTDATTTVTVSKNMNITATFEQEISVRRDWFSSWHLTAACSFTSATGNTINYSVDRPGKVTIAVFDVAGKQVAVPVDNHVAPGRYTASLHALPAGMYWVRMRSSGGEAARRITISR